jgi:hypothetical protein
MFPSISVAQREAELIVFNRRRRVSGGPNAAAEASAKTSNTRVLWRKRHKLSGDLKFVWLEKSPDESRRGQVGR